MQRRNFVSFKLRLALPLSVLAHAVVALLLVSHSVDRMSETSQPTTVEVQFSTQLTANSSSVTFSDQKKSAKQRKRITLAKLRPDHWGQLGKTGPTGGLNGNSETALDSDRSESAQAYMLSMGASQTLEVLPFFELFWERVNQVVGYPDELSQRNIEGQVDVQLEIEGDGKFHGRFLKVHSNNRYLETYVIACLLQGLREPIQLPAKLTPLGRLPVSLTFQFKTYEEVKPSVNGSHFKNYLVFHKSAFLSGRASRTWHGFFNNYLPPLVPIPGGFAVDFVRAYQIINQIAHPHNQELDLAKLKAWQETFELLIRKNKVPLPNGSSHDRHHGRSRGLLSSKVEREIES